MADQSLKTIEQKRARLLRLHAKYPENTRLLQALHTTLRPAYVRAAAQRGVFLCYNRADELFTLELALSLQQAGIAVWMDVLNIAEGDDWREAVATALQACGVMLLVLTPEATTDGELHREYRRFAAQGKIVVPVLHRDCDVNHFGLPVPAIDLRRDVVAGTAQLVLLLSQNAHVT